jgi:Ferric reductase like transmembrane component
MKFKAAMDQNNWYALALAFLAGILLLYQASGLCFTRIRFKLLKYLVYPLIVKRRYWSSVTRAEAILFGVYVLTNGLGLGPLPASRGNLVFRTGFIATVNLMPLFLGGRTNYLANLLNTPLQSYYLAHHWVGRMAILLALMHVGLVIFPRGPPRTLEQTISGSIVSVIPNL